MRVLQACGFVEYHEQCTLSTILRLSVLIFAGSSLDVAAIQQDTPLPLDYNAELVTVGTPPVITRGLHCIGISAMSFDTVKMQSCA